MKSDLKSKIKVLVVDDHPLVIEGIKSSLQKQSRFVVVGEAANGLEAIQRARALKPEMVVMDISMQVMNGLEAASLLLDTNPKVEVVLLTEHHDRKLVRQIVQSGARGYVRKNASPAELVGAIESLHRGDVSFTPDAAQSLVTDYVQSHRRSITPGPQSLSKREEQVLGFIAEGLSSKQIADRLRISVRTAQKHRETLMEKLGVHKATELVKVAITRGLIHLSADRSW